MTAHDFTISKPPLAKAMADVVGLYDNPPKAAAALCVDEKYQALVDVVANR